MKQLITCMALFVLMSFMNNETVYKYSITTADGEETSLEKFSGKPMIIVVLPVTHTISDTLLLLQMDSLGREHKDSMLIIGVPSYEDGFEDDSLLSFVTWYKSLAGESIIITIGTNTRKNSPYQSELFQWLTNKDLNGHFDDDVAGASSKYFINRSGNLCAVLGDAVPLINETVETILKNNN